MRDTSCVASVPKSPGFLAKKSKSICQSTKLQSSTDTCHTTRISAHRFAARKQTKRIKPTRNQRKRVDLPNTSAATGVEGNEHEVGPALEHLLSVCALQQTYTQLVNTSNLPLLCVHEYLARSHIGAGEGAQKKEKRRNSCINEYLAKIIEGVELIAS